MKKELTGVYNLAHATMLNQNPPQGAFSPIFTALGYYRRPKGETRYYLSIRGEVRCFRAIEMHGHNLLMDIHPDPEHWRSQFPTKLNGNRINTTAVMAYFVRLCQEVGPYDPPEDLKPADAGRPKGARDTYQRTRSKNGSKTTV